jgi:hypothetical protein
MSINPVPPIPTTPEASAGDTNVRPAATSPPTSAEDSFSHPDSGDAPKQELRSPQSTPATSEIPSDEVQVQRDSATEEIVIKYVDRSGNVILQVPSSEVLDVARVIDQNLQQAGKKALDVVRTDDKDAR